MSGICVRIHKNQERPVARETVDALLQAMRYPNRGSTKTVVAGSVGGGMYNAFTDGAGGGVFENENLIVLCDAEIHNFRDFWSASGREGFSEASIIADLYQKHHENWWKEIAGPFAVFIWEKQAQKGFAFTDRIGIKPLVYWEDSEGLVIASKIAAIAAMPGFKREISPQAVFSYLHMEMIPTPGTIYKDVRKLESGHCLRIDKGQARVEKYWSMQYPQEKWRDEKKLKEKIQQLMLQAVQRDLDYRSSIQNVGAFLSGGTDSSLVAGLISQLHPGEAKTFSMGFDEPGYDEMEYVHIAVNAFKTQSHEYYVTPDDILKSLPIIIKSFDEPYANSSVIPTYFCAAKARENGINVLLGGDGGDEVFGGNTRYLEYFSNFQRFPNWAVTLAGKMLAPLPNWSKKGIILQAENYVKRANAPLHERIHAYDISYYFPDYAKIFHKDFLMQQKFVRPQDIAQHYLEGAGTKDALDQFLFHDLKITLMDNDLRKVNRMTELAGIKVRYPFLDHEVVEFSGLIPSDLKVHNGQLRYLYKESFRHMLPKDIINKKKHGFGIPVVRWMLREGELNKLLMDTLFDGRLKARNIFQNNFIDGLYKKSKSDKTSYFGSYLYYLFVLELWMREHADAK